METYTIYDFYNFVQNISIVFSVGFAVILFFFCVLAFLNCWNSKWYQEEKVQKKESCNQKKKKTLSDGTIEITRYREL